MPTAVWTDGNSDGDWTHASNWTGGSGSGGIPAADDDVIIATSSRDITTNIVQTYALDSLTIGPKFTGTIGTQALPLSLGNVTTFTYGQKVGSMGIYSSGITTANIESTSTENPALAITEKNGGGNTVITNINIFGGLGTVLLDKVTPAAASVLTMINCKSVTVEIGTGSDVSDMDVVMGEGRLISYMVLEDVIISGGLLVYAPATGAIPSITMYDGTFKWNGTGDNQITLLTMYGGFFDSRGSITTSQSLSNGTLYEGAIFDERSGLNNISYTNPLELNGAIVKLNPTRTVDIA